MIIIHRSSEHGHRPSYERYFSTFAAASVENKYWKLLFTRKTVFFPMIEDAGVYFYLVVLLRIFFRADTVGVLMQPLRTLEGISLRVKAKRNLLEWFKSTRHLTVLTLLSHRVYPELSLISDDWIHDPQLVEKAEVQVDKDGAQRLLDTETVVRSKNNPLLISIGWITELKGSNFLSKILTENRDSINAVIAGEKICNNLKKTTQRFNNVSLVERYLSDGEVEFLFSQAKFVWACYSEEYDQASGLFSKAVQCGAIPVVRKNSYLEHFSRSEGLLHQVVDINALDCFSFERYPEHVSNDQAVRRFRLHNESVLGRVFNNAY